MHDEHRLLGYEIKSGKIFNDDKNWLLHGTTSEMSYTDLKGTLPVTKLQRIEERGLKKRVKKEDRSYENQYLCQLTKLQ